MTESSEKKEGITVSNTDQSTPTKWKSRLAPKVSYFHGKEIVPPEYLVSLSDTAFKKRYYKSIDRLSKNGKPTKIPNEGMPLEQLLERSLKLNKINPKDRSKVEAFAVSLINEFALTMENMMLNDNYLFHWPVRKTSYIYLSQQSYTTKEYAHEYSYDSVHRCSTHNGFYIDHVLDKNRKLTTSRVPQHAVGLRAYSKEKIKNKIRGGRVFLQKEEYRAHIRSGLTYSQFIRIYHKKYINKKI